MTRSRSPIRSSKPIENFSWRWWITHIAFVLGMSVVVARLITVDFLREPFQIAPGSGPLFHGPGPATSLWFDLLAIVPAILVLLRRSVDASFQLVGRISHLLLFLLIGWLLLSIGWSADRFAAVIASAHMLAGASLFWAMSQIVRGWARFRIVVAIAFGLLVVLVVQFMLYRYVDQPANIQNWNEKKADILKANHWTPDSFAARQFERKLLGSDLIIFFASPNTVAAITELLCAACIGIGIQRWMQSDTPNWLIMPAVIAVCTTTLLIAAKSKTSVATPLIGLPVVIVLWIGRKSFRAIATPMFWTGIAGIVLAMMAVLLLGEHQHGLFPGHFSDSLNFRWKYWVAAAGVFREHPLAGVGWANFGTSYLAHRLPEASEEIQDPHNFLIRFLVELGIVGGLLCIGWLIVLAREIVGRSETDLKLVLVDNDVLFDMNMTAGVPVAICVLGVALGTFASLDTSLPILDSLALQMKPLLFLLAVVLASVWGSMRSPQSWKLDGRTSSLTVLCLLVGLGIFLLHNLIDFAMFEPGALFIFMTLLGTGLAMIPAPTCRPIPRAMVITGAIIAMAVWVLAAIRVVIPITMAEQASITANDFIASATPNSPDEAAHFASAAGLLAQASALVPYNYDYLLREAQARAVSGDGRAIQALLNRAKVVDPLSIDVYLTDANFQQAMRSPNVQQIREDYDRIVQLNPNQVSLRLAYARALDQLNLRADARVQYQLSLHFDDLLNPGEPKRLSPEQRAEVSRRIAQP